MKPHQITMLVAVSVVIIAAVLAALGFRGRDVVVGMDLGTTYSTVAYRSNGRLSVMRNEGDNSTITASVLAISSHKFIVGKAAAGIVGVDVMSTVFDAKRILGRRWDDEILQAERQRHGGRVVPHPSVVRDAFGKVATGKKLNNCPTCESEVAFVLRTTAAFPGDDHLSRKCLDPGSVMDTPRLSTFLSSRTVDASFMSDASPGSLFVLVTPTAAACMVIETMMLELGRELGHRQFKSAVVTIPAEFNGAQRQVTIDAYARTGILASRVIHEPAAAAIAYGLHQQPHVKYILVFDMGGGTLDVSVLFVQKGAITVIGSAGDGHLGGEDVDDCVLGQLTGTLQSVHGVSVDSHEGAHTAADTCTVSWLRKEAERVKIAFGDPTVDSVSWSCHHHGSAVGGELTRSDFYGSCEALFQRTLEPVRAGLLSANLEAVEVDEVVLVGGSSRLLRVRELLEAYFKKPLRHTVDPDLAVAMGASMIID